MLKVDPTVQTLTAAGIIAIAISVLVNGTLNSYSQDVPPSALSRTNGATAGGTQQAVWAASATGRVEPKDGEVRLVAQQAGEIVEVLAKTGDAVAKDDLLVKVDDSDLFAKRNAALAEEAVRVRERDEEEAVKSGPDYDRRQAEDAAAAAERALFDARQAFDDAAVKVSRGETPGEEPAALRTKIADAEKKLAEERAKLASVSARDDMPLPSRLESGLAIARSELTQIENAIERARVRAPYDGTVLNVWARLGETAAASPELPLVLFGDITTLRVRTEVEERDVVKVKVGQKAIIRADAFGEQEFTGTVTSMAPALGSPRILSRGPRRPNDIEVLEAMVTLDGAPPLMTGMRVDVFFKAEDAGS